MTTEEHCFYCFDVLTSHLSNTQCQSPGFENASYPLFVTWHTRDNNGSMSLRGCIGTFRQVPLHSGLSEYSLNSALNDSRFPPIIKEELPKLCCSVSLLVNFEDATSWDDWEIGLHGIKIIYEDCGYNYSGTFLPEVAKEQGWTRKETMLHLLRKARFTKHESRIEWHKIKVIRYQSSKRQVSFQDYLNKFNK